LTFDLLTLKVVSKSRVTWATSVPIVVFLGLSVLDSGPMYATDRRQTDRRQTKASLNASALWGGGIIIRIVLHNAHACSFSIAKITSFRHQRYLQIHSPDGSACAPCWLHQIFKQGVSLELPSSIPIGLWKITGNSNWSHPLNSFLPS